MKRLVFTVLLIVSIIAGAFQVSADAGADDIYQVNIQMTAIDLDMPGIPDVENAINEITVPSIGVRVHIVPVFIGNLAADTAYAVASKDKLDIVNVGLTNGITTMVSEGILMPLDYLLESRGKAVIEATKNVSEAQRVNGITYAVSQFPYAANCGGLFYNVEMAREFGIEMHDNLTLEDLTEIGSVLKENGIALMANGLSPELSYKFFCTAETFGESGNYGMILNPDTNTEIINIFASEEFREYYRTIRKWFESGYLPENQMLDASSVMFLFVQKKIFAVPTNVTAKQIGISKSAGFESAVVKMSDVIITTSGATEFMLGIASTCENPEKTMDFLNLIYTNPELANLLNYGLEGVNYKVVEGTENVITTEGMDPDGIHTYGSGFVSFGNPLQLRIKSPLTDEYYDELVSWEEKAKKSLTFGYTFDVGDYSVEAINIAKVLNEYLPILNVGLASDVDAQIDKMNEELKIAGIDEVISANKKSLDKYKEK